MKSINESILSSFKKAFLLEDYKSAKTKLVEKGASEQEVDSLINRHKELKKLNRLDKSLIDIDRIVKEFSPSELKQKLFNISTQTKSEIKKRIEGKIVAENSEYLVYKIDTPEEAYRFHGLTEWCICSGTEDQARTHFNHYLNGFKNVFYFFVRKNITDPDDEWNYIALQRQNKNKDVYWSMIDKDYKLPKIPVNLPKFNKPPLEPLTLEEKMVFSGLKKNTNGEFDIDGDFHLLDHKYLIVDGKLAIKFGKVGGYFSCAHCDDLTSLEGCPKEVGGDFSCSYCENLTSLKGCPQKVEGDFNCSGSNSLKNLEGCPEKVGENFDCSRCINLTSLEGSPKTVRGHFDCSHCKNLTNLMGCPERVGRDFYCSNCENLTSLKGCPKTVVIIFDCQNCDRLTSLEGCPEKVGEGFYCSYCGNLTSLKGCPKKIDGSFDCSGCANLKSLKDCPEKVGVDFVCNRCRTLTNLEGCPKEVGGCFYCYDCGVKFTEDYVKSLCNVGRKIFVRTY